MNKIIGAVVLLLLLAAGGYFFYGKPASQSVNLVSGQPSEQTGTSTAAQPEKTLQRLNRLQDINLNTDFFTTQTFRSLKNFGIAIKPLPTGRDNPFRLTNVRTQARVIEKAQESQLSTDNNTTTSSDELAATSTATTTSKNIRSATSSGSEGSAR